MTNSNEVSSKRAPAQATLLAASKRADGMLQGCRLKASLHARRLRKGFGWLRNEGRKPYRQRLDRVDTCRQKKRAAFRTGCHQRCEQTRAASPEVVQVRRCRRVRCRREPICTTEAGSDGGVSRLRGVFDTEGRMLRQPTTKLAGLCRVGHRQECGEDGHGHELSQDERHRT